MRKTQESSVRWSVLACSLVVLLWGSGATSAQTLASQPDLINWVYGPSKADLGEAAQIEVPSGFRFANATEAATVLRAAGNPSPSSVAGLIAPISGNYMVVFEYTPIGYVKAGAGDEVDADAALAGLRKGLARQNNGYLQANLEWETAPTYDGAARTVEWAIVVTSGSRKTVNHVVRLLGREGVLDGIAISSGNSAGVPLKQLMKGVAFKSGFAYADYRKGDRVAEHGLTDLIATQTPEKRTQTSYMWAYVGGGAGLLTVGGFTLLLRRRRRVERAPRRTAPVVRPIHVNGNGLKPATLTATTSNGHYNGNGSLNGKAAADTNGNTRRKRMFDYQRFYSDLMFEVSDRAQLSTGGPSPGRQPAATAAPESRHAPVSEMSALSNAGLIEHQRRLIEEQQRLIREQAKLIEEKSRLIQEKNQVLDKQAELFGNNIF